jgi:hypothetical protein
MGNFVPLTDQHLLRAIAQFPDEIRQDDSKRAFILSLAVVRYFFGLEWIEEHISVENPTPGFLRLVAGSTSETHLSTFKIVDFAELLHNLQGIGGFDGRIDQMKKGNIESTYAELDFGRMLYLGGVNFRFVDPQGKRGADYDIEITLPDGVIVCADAKCKIEATEFSMATVENTLHDARSQFPPDRPSAIFVKIPPKWVEQLDTTIATLEVGRRFLRGTGRIVSIKFYVQHSSYAKGTITHSHGFKEISNPNNRFDATRNWEMFGNPQPTTGWNGLPLIWKRLLFFPKHGPDEKT